jgi:hypothetical protein
MTYFVTASFSNPATNFGNVSSEDNWPIPFDGSYDFLTTSIARDQTILIPNFCYHGPLPFSVYIGFSLTDVGPTGISFICFSSDPHE